MQLKPFTISIAIIMKVIIMIAIILWLYNFCAQSSYTWRWFFFVSNVELNEFLHSSQCCKATMKEEEWENSWSPQHRVNQARARARRVWM